MEAYPSSCLLGKSACCPFVTWSLGTQLAKQGGSEFTNVLLPLAPYLSTATHTPPPPTAV